MTASEYANKLIARFKETRVTKFPLRCALICIEEMIEREKANGEYYNSVSWLESVKNEILKM